MIEVMFGLALALTDGAFGTPSIAYVAVEAWEQLQPARLVSFDPDRGTVGTDFRTMAECERARQAAIREMERRRAAAGRRVARTASPDWRSIVEPNCFPGR